VVSYGPVPVPEDVPQQKTAPLVTAAHEVPPPAEIETTFSRYPPPAFSTRVKRERFWLVPSPIAPAEFDPMHQAAPSVVRAQMWYAPPSISATPVRNVSPVFFTRTARKLASPVPSPTPAAFVSPQHQPAPPLVTAQLLIAPAPTATTFSSGSPFIFFTWTAVVRRVSVPSPSEPK